MSINLRHFLYFNTVNTISKKKSSYTKLIFVYLQIIMSKMMDKK